MKKVSKLGLLVMGMMITTATLADTTGRGAYFGLFGGAAAMRGDGLSQNGTAYKYGDFGLSEGPGEHIDYDLVVHQKGNVKNDTVGIGGVQLGYEWGSSNVVKPAIEVEAFYIGGDLKAHTSNPGYEETYVADTPNNRTNYSEDIGDPVYPAHGINPGLHQFSDRAKMHSAVFMLSGALSFDTGTMLTPYIGAGVGFARTNLTNAKSIQVCGGAEPCATEYTYADSGVLVNHFNSRNHAADYAPAAQLKLGLRAQVSDSVSVFAEYRYLHVNSSDYKFGSTNYPGYHAATSPWKVSIDSLDYHAGLVGLQVAF